MEHLVPITFCAGLFTWLVAGNHYQTQEKLHLAAIEHGLVRVTLGGSFSINVRDSRSAYRLSVAPDNRRYDVGARLLRIR